MGVLRVPEELEELEGMVDRVVPVGRAATSPSWCPTISRCWRASSKRIAAPARVAKVDLLEKVVPAAREAKAFQAPRGAPTGLPELRERMARPEWMVLTDNRGRGHRS